MVVKINQQIYKWEPRKDRDIKKPLNILQLCEFFNIDIPKFCYHEHLSVAGNCRMCLVEVEKAPKPIVSCANPVMPNMTIFTETPLVKKARENVLELLLLNHPLDCPICDQGGECDLQENTKDYASDRNRNFNYQRRQVEDKNTGPIIKTIMTRCIHCTRCVRFITETNGKDFLRPLGRATNMEIGSYVEKFIKHELSGNLVDICPVGALTSRPYAFTARYWELKKMKAVDPLDIMGTNIMVHTRNMSVPKNFQKKKGNNLEHDQILRIVPYFNQNINDQWISDKTRYAFDGLYNNRLSKIKYKYKINKNENFLKTINNIDWFFIFKKFSKNLVKFQNFNFINNKNFYNY